MLFWINQKIIWPNNLRHGSKLIKIKKSLKYFLLFSLLLFSGFLFESFANVAISTGSIRANEVNSVSPLNGNKIASQKSITSLQQTSDWYEDCDDISDWTDARGTDFETNAFRGYQEDLTDSFTCHSVTCGLQPHTCGGLFAGPTSPWSQLRRHT